MAADIRSSLTLAEARQKCTEKHSSFTKLQHVEHMCLPPSYIGRLKQGIVDELDKKLMKFCDKLEAVIVAYDKIELLQRRGSLVDESPFLHFGVRVDYIVFKPEVDHKLIGVVNKFGYDHIGCLVHGCFNAAIAKCRVSNGLYSSLALGSEFTFRVIGLEALNGVLSISGAVEGKSSSKRNSQGSSKVKHSYNKASTSSITEETLNHKTQILHTEVCQTPKKKKKVSTNTSSEPVSINNNIESQTLQPSVALSAKRTSGKDVKKKRHKDKTRTM